jgi:hypothetical protein
MGTMKSRDSPEGHRQLRRKWSRAAVSSRVCPLEVRISTEEGTPLDSTVTSNTTVPSIRAERAAEGYEGAGNRPPPAAEKGTGWVPPGVPPARAGRAAEGDGEALEVIAGGAGAGLASAAGAGFGG